MNQLIGLLKSSGLSIACAESLTGGLFASELCQQPGASQVFKGGVIAYQTSIKHDVLGVEQWLIDNYGVVSAEVAQAMAQAALTLFQSDIAVSFTGNAGPTVQDNRPVGMVFMAIATKDKSVVFNDMLVGDRNRIRQQCVELMFERLMTMFRNVSNV